jgi:hypothetical protein
MDPSIPKSFWSETSNPQERHVADVGVAITRSTTKPISLTIHPTIL